MRWLSSLQSLAIYSQVTHEEKETLRVFIKNAKVKHNPPTRATPIYQYEHNNESRYQTQQPRR
jgi:hypothetical protein